MAIKNYHGRLDVFIILWNQKWEYFNASPHKVVITMILPIVVIMEHFC